MKVESGSDRVELHHGDCIKVLKKLKANSVDSVVTDPPYELKFMGKQWDGTGIAFRIETWREVFRVLKPGGHLVAFGATRNYHRMACAIEDAGFEIRDCLMWLFGTGFPKSHDVSKGIDRAAGAEREVIGSKMGLPGYRTGPTASNEIYAQGRGNGDGACEITCPATPQAAEWQGWGTSLKPAVEPVVLARKPLSEGTVAANVLRWRTGALNIDACRVDGKPRTTHADGNKRTIQGNPFLGTLSADHRQDEELLETGVVREGSQGRWPANVVHSGEPEVVEEFPSTGPSTGRTATPTKGSAWAIGAERSSVPGGASYDDAGGSAARFFFSAKANSDDRLGSKHPTVKPVALMAWLVRLITPKDGVVLDLFAGTGTVGHAALHEGVRAILIEKDEKYVADIKERLANIRRKPNILKPLGIIPRLKKKRGSMLRPNR